MALKERKITESGIAAHGVSAAPDRMTGTAAENKKVFDNLVREVVAESVNGIVDELTGENGAEQIGMKPVEGIEGQTVQEGFSALLGKLQHWEKEITGSVVNVPVDEVPTEGSVGVPSSGGTWAALQGLAPGGFGLGEEAPEEAASADEAVNSGWYIVPDPDNAEKKMLLFTESMDENSKKQTVHRFAGGSMKRNMVDGAWGAWVGFDRVGDVVFSSRNMEVETEGQYIALDGRTMDGNAYEKLSEVAWRERVPEPVRHFEGAELVPSGGIGYRSEFLGDDLVFLDSTGAARKFNLLDGTALVIAPSGGGQSTVAMRVCNEEVLIVRGNSYGTTFAVYNFSGLVRTQGLGSVNYIYSDGKTAIASNGTSLYRSTDNFANYVTSAGLGSVGADVTETSLHKPIEKYGDHLYAVNGTTVYRSADDGVSWFAMYTITTDLGTIVTQNDSSRNKHFIHDGYLYFLCAVTNVGTVLLKIDLESGECKGHATMSSTASVGYNQRLCGAVYNNTAYCAFHGSLFKIDLATMNAEAWEPYPNVTSCDSTKDIYTVDDLMFIETSNTVTPDYHKDDGTGMKTVCVVVDLRTEKSVALYNSSGWDVTGMSHKDDAVYFTLGSYSSSKYTNGALNKIDLTQRVLPEIDFGYVKAMEG